MSRSYRKVYGHCDRNPFMKNLANRRVRRVDVNTTVPNGRAYKKFSCSYDICDFRSIDYTKKQFVDTLISLYKRGFYRREMDRLNISFEEIVRREIKRDRSK
jgi:hypothetical protein